MITLRNNFHGTQARVLPVPVGDWRYRISNATARRLRRTLCGIATCTCGGTFGERPEQVKVVAQTNNAYIVEIERED